MDYTTIYQVTTVEPQQFQQVVQELFHFHSDLYTFGSFSNSIAFLIFVYSFILAVVVLALWRGGLALAGQKQPSNLSQNLMLLCLTPVCLTVVLAAILYGQFQIHAELASKYAAGQYLKLEGTIKDAQFADHGRAQKAIFKVNDETVVIYSNHVGFDDPANKLIGDGQVVRICMIDGHGNPPTILRFEVKKPVVGNRPRKLVNW